jgi:hypothetical protein
MIADGQRSNEGVERNELSPSQAELCAVGLGRVIARVWTAVAARVPVGYEDEAGFHLVMKSPMR